MTEVPAKLSSLDPSDAFVLDDSSGTTKKFYIYQGAKCNVSPKGGGRQSHHVRGGDSVT